MNESATPPSIPAEDEATHDAASAAIDQDAAAAVIDQDAASAAMKHKMQGDVAAWAASRADAPSPSLVPARAQYRSATPKTPAPKPAAKPVVAAAPVPGAPRKPFAMKYDGLPAGRYAAERFDRGAR